MHDKRLLDFRNMLPFVRRVLLGLISEVGDWKLGAHHLGIQDRHVIQLAVDTQALFNNKSRQL